MTKAELVAAFNERAEAFTAVAKSLTMSQFVTKEQLDLQRCAANGAAAAWTEAARLLEKELANEPVRSAA